MTKKSKISSYDKLEKTIHRLPSESKFQMYRNLSFGAASVCLIIVVSLAQIWTESVALKLSLCSAAIGIPLWIGLGGIYEYYILVGKKSYSHYRNSYAQSRISFLTILGGLTLLTTIGSLLYYLDGGALFCFVVSVFLIIWLTTCFIYNLANELFTKES